MVLLPNFGPNFGILVSQDPVRMFLRIYKLLATMDVPDWCRLTLEKTHTGMNRVQLSKI